MQRQSLTRQHGGWNPDALLAESDIASLHAPA
jgi:hypothetical protein